MSEEQQNPANEPNSSELTSSEAAASTSPEVTQAESAVSKSAEAHAPNAGSGTPAEQHQTPESSKSKPFSESEQSAPRGKSSTAAGSETETDASRRSPAAPRDSAPAASPAPDSRKKPELVVKQSGKLTLPQNLKRTGSVAKVAGSKLLRDAGEGLVGVSEWLEGQTSEKDLAEAAAVQEDLEERFDGTWQTWGGILDQVKSPLPKKVRRISNARLTGLLVGILVFLFLALSSAISGPGSQAKDADTPLTRQSRRPANSKLVKSRSSKDTSTKASGSKTSKSDTAASSSGKKNVSAADFFGEDSPRKAPPLSRTENPRPRATNRSATAPTPDLAANPPANPYAGYAGYPPPAYGQPPSGSLGGSPSSEVNPEAPYPGAYPPPYPYPPYFYAPPPGYPGSAEGSNPALMPGQAGEDGQVAPAPQPYPYGGYAPYPYPPVAPAPAGSPDSSDKAALAEKSKSAKASNAIPSAEVKAAASNRSQENSAKK